MNQQQNDTNSPMKIRKYTVESEEACFFHPLTNIYSDNESVRKYYQWKMIKKNKQPQMAFQK